MAQRSDAVLTDARISDVWMFALERSEYHGLLLTNDLDSSWADANGSSRSA